MHVRGWGGVGARGVGGGALISVLFSASVLHKSQMLFFFFISFLFYFFIHVVCDSW